MRCEDCRDALSARLDGEAPGATVAELDDHVAGCADCRRFAIGITDVHRTLRVRPAEVVPDLTGAILAALPPQPIPAPTPAPIPAAASTTVGWLRYGLVVIGLTMLALAVPSLVLHDSGVAIHLTRELSAWDLAFGAGLLFAAWQPARARGLLPMAAVLAAGLALGSIIDVTSGRSPALDEAHHLLQIAGVVLLWFLCRQVERPLPAPSLSTDSGLRSA